MPLGVFQLHKVQEIKELYKLGHLVEHASLHLKGIVLQTRPLIRTWVSGS